MADEEKKVDEVQETPAEQTAEVERVGEAEKAQSAAVDALPKVEKAEAPKPEKVADKASVKAPKGYKPRLKADYEDRIVQAMTEKFGYKNRFEVPKLAKIVINMPYITASIVIQLGATLYGPWQQLRKEGETGRKKLNQYTRYLTVMITLVQGYLAIRGLESQSMRQGISAVVTPGLLFEVAGTVSLVGGTLFLMST